MKMQTIRINKRENLKEKQKFCGNQNHNARVEYDNPLTVQHSLALNMRNDKRFKKQKCFFAIHF